MDEVKTEREWYHEVAGKMVALIGASASGTERVENEQGEEEELPVVVRYRKVAFHADHVVGLDNGRWWFRRKCKVHGGCVITLQSGEQIRTTMPVVEAMAVLRFVNGGRVSEGMSREEYDVLRDAERAEAAGTGTPAGEGDGFSGERPF